MDNVTAKKQPSARWKQHSKYRCYLFAHQLVFALVFLVAHCQGRTSYPEEGWSNSDYIFTDSDLEVMPVFSFCCHHIVQGGLGAPEHGDGEAGGRDQLPGSLLPSQRVQPSPANQRQPRPQPAHSHHRQVGVRFKKTHLKSESQGGQSKPVDGQPLPALRLPGLLCPQQDSVRRLCCLHQGTSWS